MEFQNLSLVGDLTVWQNIVMGAEEKKGLYPNDTSAIDLSKETVDQLLPVLDIKRMVLDLNPGEMQIVEIAKAISARPKLLILDEPTAALVEAQFRTRAFMVNSTFFFLAAVYFVGRNRSGDARTGDPLTLRAIAAAMVGGVSLTGGDGNYVGVILGAIFLQTLTNLLVAMGWGDAGKWVGFGVVLFILLIVYVSNRRSR